MDFHILNCRRVARQLHKMKINWRSNYDMEQPCHENFFVLYTLTVIESSSLVNFAQPSLSSRKGVVIYWDSTSARSRQIRIDFQICRSFMISVWSVFETQSVITCGMKVRSILELGTRTHSDSVLFAKSRDAQKQIEHELLQSNKKLEPLLNVLCLCPIAVYKTSS